MALLNSFEKSGNFLFKYRGQIPVFIFVIGLPFIYCANYQYLFIDAEPKMIIIGVIRVMAILLSVLGFLIRAYTIGTTPRGTSGRNTEKQVASQLNTTGIYSIVRHPLYLGNYLMWAGLLLFTMNVPLLIIISLLFWLYYERIMFAEEAYLNAQFGEEFLSWSNRVPAFIPAFRQFEKGSISFSFKAVLRREYTGIFAMVLAYTLVDYALLFSIACYFQTSISNDMLLRPSLVILLLTFVMMLVLRTLKHHTRLLDPDSNRD